MLPQIWLDQFRLLKIQYRIMPAFASYRRKSWAMQAISQFLARKFGLSAGFAPARL
jgi:hypothetical protein